MTDPDGPDVALATAPGDHASDLTQTFLDHALAQTGDDYVFGPRPRLTTPIPGCSTARSSPSGRPPRWA